MTVNLVSHPHVRAPPLHDGQWEIRQLFKQFATRSSGCPRSLAAPRPEMRAAGYRDEMGNRDEHCRIKPHRDTVMAVDAYRGGSLEDTDGPDRVDRAPSAEADGVRCWSPRVTFDRCHRRAGSVRCCRGRGRLRPGLDLSQLSRVIPSPRVSAGAPGARIGQAGARRRGRAHLRRVDDQERVPAFVAIEHDPIVAVEADAPVRLELDDLGEDDLLGEPAVPGTRRSAR